MLPTTRNAADTTLWWLCLKTYIKGAHSTPLLAKQRHNQKYVFNKSSSFGLDNNVRSGPQIHIHVVDGWPRVGHTLVSHDCTCLRNGLHERDCSSVFWHVKKSETWPKSRTESTEWASLKNRSSSTNMLAIRYCARDSLNCPLTLSSTMLAL